jgi:hypothetical protein
VLARLFETPAGTCGRRTVGSFLRLVHLHSYLSHHWHANSLKNMAGRSECEGGQRALSDRAAWRPDDMAAMPAKTILSSAVASPGDPT